VPSAGRAGVQRTDGRRVGRQPPPERHKGHGEACGLPAKGQGKSRTRAWHRTVQGSPRVVDKVGRHALSHSPPSDPRAATGKVAPGKSVSIAGAAASPRFGSKSGSTVGHAPAGRDGEELRGDGVYEGEVGDAGPDNHDEFPSESDFDESLSTVRDLQRCDITVQRGTGAVKARTGTRCERERRAPIG